jgi:hypothetical protein
MRSAIEDTLKHAAGRSTRPVFSTDALRCWLELVRLYVHDALILHQRESALMAIDPHELMAVVVCKTI